MQSDRTLDLLIDELVAAVEERECADPDGRDWRVEARIRRLERTLLETYRLLPRPMEIRPDRGPEGLPVPRTLDLVGVRAGR
jgi:hypothetical protein